MSKFGGTAADPSANAWLTWRAAGEWIASLALAVFARQQLLDGRIVSGALFLAGACALFPPIVHLLQRDHDFSMPVGKRLLIAGTLLLAGAVAAKLPAQLSGRMTDTAEACLRTQAAKRHAEIRHLGTSSVRYVTLTEAQKLNGTKAMAHFHMTFTARAPGGNWLDHDMYMTATLTDKKLEIGAWLSDVPLFLGFGGWRCVRDA